MKIHSAPFQKLKSATFCYMVALKSEKNEKKKECSMHGKGKAFQCSRGESLKKKKKNLARYAPIF